MTQILDTTTEDFEDLDALLAEAVEVAEARKIARKAGTKTPAAVAAIVREADVELAWEPQFSIARFIESHCDCGHSHRRFDGWFIVSSHRRDPYARRYVRSDDHQNLPAWQYVAEEATEECAECLSSEALPLATIDLLSGIDALGEPAFCCTPMTDQIAFYLSEEAEAPTTDEEEDLEVEEAEDDLAL